MKVIVIAKGNYFGRYGEELLYAFHQAGHQSILFNEDTYEVPQATADLFVVVGPNVYNHNTVRVLNGKKIAILTEQLPHLGKARSPFTDDRLRQFHLHEHVYDGYVEWSRECFEYLKHTHPGLNIARFTHGYLPAGKRACIDGDSWKQIKTENCEWDVCFLGAISPRRRQVIQQLAGLNVYPNHEDVWGDEQKEALSKSRIVLNMHYDYAPDSFEAHRIFESVRYKRPIISEWMDDDSEIARSIWQADYNHLAQLTNIMIKSDLLDNQGINLNKIARQYPMSDLVDIIINMVA